MCMPELVFQVQETKTKADSKEMKIGSYGFFDKIDKTY